MSQIEGPSIITIPELKFLSCSRCKYFQQTMWRSGRDPEYKYNCIHHESKGFKIQLGGHGNLTANYYNIIVTPDWCPVQKNNKNEVNNITH